MLDSNNSDPKASRIYPTLSIYKVRDSRYWYLRLWDSEKRKYTVKSTRETSKILAREAAIDFAKSVLQSKPLVETQYSFRYFALKALKKGDQLVAQRLRHVGTVKANALSIQNPEWGLLRWFGNKDIRKITTRDYSEYMADLENRRPDLTASTKATVMSSFRNVLKVARDDGVINDIPATPRPRQRDNPRPFFRFSPLGTGENDAYRKLLKTARQMAEEKVVVRGIPVTYELYDLIIFTTQSFVRPIASELYAIKHNDITVSQDPPGLLVEIRKGKTGHRIAATMPEAVEIYDRIKVRYPDFEGEDYLFLPAYQNRTTAGQIIQRQFRELLDRADLKVDKHTGKEHELYSLRHTAICMRIVKSHGHVNIFTLAKNAGTSVDQIERFYAKHLPMVPALWRNLQSFGEA